MHGDEFNLVRLRFEAVREVDHRQNLDIRAQLGSRVRTVHVAALRMARRADVQAVPAQGQSEIAANGPARPWHRRTKQTERNPAQSRTGPARRQTARSMLRL